MTSLDPPKLHPFHTGGPETLANALGARELDGKWNVRVSMTLYYDGGHSNQSQYGLSILTPHPVTNVLCSSRMYTLTVSSGHHLNRLQRDNRITVRHNDPDAGVSANIIQFDIEMDGSMLVTDDGRLYIFALAADGPHVFNEPNWIEPDGAQVTARDYKTFYGPRPDLHLGNEAEVDDDTWNYPDEDVWLRSRVTDVDVTLVGKTRAEQVRGVEGIKTAKFS